MQQNENSNKLPVGVLGILIFAAGVVIALAIYWVGIVQDIMEAKALVSSVFDSLISIV